MVALTVGGIAISSVYAIGMASTRGFRRQTDIANAQTSLRMAMDQLKRDIARAGYLGTPDASLPGQSCGPVDPQLHAPAGSGRIAAIARFRNDVAVTQANGNTALAPMIVGNEPSGSTVNQTAGFTADELVMFGNYSTGAEYPILRDASDDRALIVQQGFYEFRRDFTQWWVTPLPLGGPAFDSGAFNEAFTVGRAIGLRRPSGEYHFATVGAVPAVGADGLVRVRIHATQTIPATCADVAYISPLNAIRYSVENAPAGVAREPEGSGPVAQLVRTEVLPGDKLTPMNIPNTTRPDRRTILDYVVGFHLAFTMTADTDEGAPDDYAVGALPLGTMIAAGPFGTTVGSTTNSPAAVAEATGHPERVRAVSIDLAVRTPEQDPRFPWSAGLCAEMRCFRVFSDRDGAARVRRMRAEVFLPNVAGAGY
jgi:hypothetical protein